MKTEFYITIFCILDHLTGKCNNTKEINSDKTAKLYMYL